MTTEPTYRLACLCDLRDERGRILLLRRKKSPNLGLCSPIGGKLDLHTGESPAQCAQREIAEEAGIHVPIERLHLGGLIAEKNFENSGHWLLFYYRVLGHVHVEPREFKEGALEWFDPQDIDALPLPDTDRKIIWPLIKQTDRPDASVTNRPGFFSVFIDCSTPDITWHVEQLEPPPLPSPPLSLAALLPRARSASEGLPGTNP